jgi:chromosome segregation ATPase
LHESLVATKDSEIKNLTLSLETKQSEIENLIACLQSQASKVGDIELSNALIREDNIRHQKEAETRFSMYQHKTEAKVRSLSSERDELMLENGKLIQSLQQKTLEIDNFLASSEIQSAELQTKKAEIESISSQLHTQIAKFKELEYSYAEVRENAVRFQKEADMRMSIYQRNADLKLQALLSARDILQSTVDTDAVTLRGFHEKYVAALADNSLLHETIRSLNNSIARMQAHTSDLESRISSKDIEIHSGKACLHELLRETDNNRQLLHSALDRHPTSSASRSADVFEQVDFLLLRYAMNMLNMQHRLKIRFSLCSKLFVCSESACS